MKYEFRVLRQPSEQELNELGAQGYRIVSAVPTQEYDPIGVEHYPTTMVYLQRESGDTSDITNAVKWGVEQAFLSWLEGMSENHANRIFGTR